MFVTEKKKRKISVAEKVEDSKVWRQSREKNKKEMANQEVTLGRMATEDFWRKTDTYYMM